MSFKKHLSHQNFSGLWLIIWGAFTANPYDCTFARQPQLYSAMSGLYDNEVFWGLFVTLIGIAVIYLNYRKRSYSAFLVGATFAFFAALFFFGDYSSRAWATYALFMAWNLTQWNIFKVEGR